MGAIDKNIWTRTDKIRTLKNIIVHRGSEANFDDYANAFITVGKNSYYL